MLLDGSGLAVEVYMDDYKDLNKKEKRKYSQQTPRRLKRGSKK